MEERDGRLTDVQVHWDRVPDDSIYPYSILSIRGLTHLSLDHPVVFFVGENGSGKSTLLEAIAVAAGLNAEGGSGHLRFSTRPSHSSLHEHLELWWRGRPKRTFFLRAESFYNVASTIEGLDRWNPKPQTSLLDYSHGESFLEAFHRYFGSRGLYLLDEPESALSVMGQLQLLRHIHDQVADGGQFLISTHSPILLAFPGAQIFQMSHRGPEPIEYTQTDPYELTKSFLEDPQRFFRHLFSDDNLGTSDQD